MKRNIYTKIGFFIVAILVALIDISAQTTFGDLGIAWKRNNYTTATGEFYNIVPQLDGTYLAVGNILKNGRYIGYIVNIKEDGTVVNDNQPQEYEVVPLNSWPEWSTGTPWSYITQAFFTNDDHIIAFGVIKNVTCDISLKGYNLSGLPLTDTEWLKNGIWVMKINRRTGQVVYNSLDRGCSEVTGGVVHQAGEQFLIVGMDYFQDGGVNYNGLMRLYDKNGSWIYDNYQTSGGQRIDFAWGLLRGQDPAGNYYLASMNNFMVINRNNFANNGNIATALSAADNACVSNPDPHITAQYPQQWEHHATFTAKPNNGGTIAQSRMSGLLTAPNVISTFGFVFYEKSPTDNLVYCNTIFDKNTFVTKTYNQLYLLPGSSNQYVGSITNRTSGSEVMHMYQYTDRGSSSEILDGIQLPYSTDIRTVSLTDGFLVSGSDPANAKNVPAIAKLSTCVNFKVTSFPNTMMILKPYESSINVSLPIQFEGAKGSVDYFLKGVVKSGTVNGKTTGEELEVTNGNVGTLPGGAGLAFNLNRTYNLGTEYAIIEYTLNLKDSYTTAGVLQSCGQTYIFRVVTAPLTDVVAIPTVKKETTGNKIQTVIKNIGIATFENYKITIYKDNLGNSVKHTYTYPYKIKMGTTAHFDIDIPTSLADASKVVVSFNDNGNGNQNQLEINNKRFTYEVNP